MAHKIDNSKGFNAFVSFQQPAWHGLGEVFKEALTTQQALERGGLDYQVLKLPNVHMMPNGEEIISEDSFFTCRTDVNKILGSRLGKDYQVLQNIEALNVVDEILQSGRATIETAGAIDEGKKVFICMKIDKSIIVGSNNDTVNQYVLMATSHDGSMATVATPTNVRVVCNNTLTAALKGATGAIKIRHTKNADSRLHEAAKVLKLIADNTEVNAENYNRMKEFKISKEDMYNYFGNVFFKQEEIEKMQKGIRMKDAVSSQKETIMQNVLSYAMNGTGQSQALNGNDLNMWFAYNAVTGYMTTKNYRTANDRANSMLFGTAADVIHDAGILAMEPAKIQTLSKVNLSGMNFN